MPHAETSPSSTTLYVNDGPLKSENIAHLKASQPDEPLDDLRKRFQDDGYLFLKGLLPRADVLKARERYFQHVGEPTGLLKPGTQAVEGIFDPAQDKSLFPGIGAGATAMNGRPGGDKAAQFVDLAVQAHKESWYTDDFCKHPVLKHFVANFTGWEENTHGFERTLLRNNVPGNKAIGVHYDQIFLRHGEDTSITAWVPMGDIAVNGGGLIYLEDGSSVGAEQERIFTSRAKEAGLSDTETRNAFNMNMMSNGLLADGPAEFGEHWGKRWLVSDFEAGDVVLHNAYAIHASTMNHDVKGVIRVATDLRFVDKSRPWDKRWTKPYEMDDGV